MSSNKLRLYCDNCNFSQWLTEEKISGLVEYKRSSIQKNIPRLVNNSVVNTKPKELPKQFKCPGCGRLIRIKTYQFKSDTENDKNID